MQQAGPTGRTLDAVNPQIRRAWYVVARSADVVAGTLFTARVHDRPLVLFREPDGTVAVLEDRCPHRSVPLSFGAAKDGTVQCGYHGWQFDGRGHCVKLPAFEGEPDHPARRATVYPSVEQQGFVWAWTAPEVEPVGAPFHFRHADDPAYLTVREVLDTPGGVHAVIENALDVPHTAFLHGGLFRRDDKPRNPVQCIVRRFHDRAECEFVGEQRPEGLAARILSPSGGEIQHTDRFHLPSITEVEYRIGTENHVVLNGACTPVTPTFTRLWAVVSVKSRLPHWLLQPVVKPLALRIFAQDVEILTLQQQSMEDFGEARFVSTEIDVLGAQILRLMHQAARGDLAEPGEPFVRETTMWL